MKRTNAETRAYGRQTAAGEANTSSLPLSPEELEEIRQAYRGGYGGEIIIGMRGEERLIIVLDPAPHSSGSFERLRKIGCDRCISVRNVG